MWQKQKNTFVTGFLLILLPLLFIFTGGVPTLSRLIGLGEGFAYQWLLFFSSSSLSVCCS
ncbi:hypothetical protein [Planococcus glaciei]|uniref:hypothetical protein n=1 Tax=Planococcus glaciei TaxID=459472 RepID=UPI0004B7F54B|nr:hypothetical protein [Planococcus glaciei]